MILFFNEILFYCSWVSMALQSVLIELNGGRFTSQTKSPHGVLDESKRDDELKSMTLYRVWDLSILSVGVLLTSQTCQPFHAKEI